MSQKPLKVVESFVHGYAGETIGFRFPRYENSCQPVRQRMWNQPSDSQFLSHSTGKYFLRVCDKTINQYLNSDRINYWRDKRGQEIDFVIVKKGIPIAIEYKWKSSNLEPDAMKSFKKIYPKSRFHAPARELQNTCQTGSGQLDFHAFTVSIIRLV